MDHERFMESFDWNIAWAAQAASILEADAPKAGNVNRYYDFADTTLADFHLSALAIGPPFGFIRQYGVGKTIYQGIRATQNVVSTNTNLGIILLLAPLAMAWSRLMDRKICPKNKEDSILTLWQEEISLVLKDLTVLDTQYVYQGIRLAAPSGMGKVEKHDVFQEASPAISLLEAMALAADRDMIARQYINNFEQVLDIGYPFFKELQDNRVPLAIAIAQTHLFLLSRYPDTLIIRKMGLKMGVEVQKRALAVFEQGGCLTPIGQKYEKRLDHWLREEGQGLNPGTTADLITGIIFVHLLINKFTGIEGVNKDATFTFGECGQ